MAMCIYSLRYTINFPAWTGYSSIPLWNVLMIGVCASLISLGVYRSMQTIHEDRLPSSIVSLERKKRVSIGSLVVSVGICNYIDQCLRHPPFGNAGTIRTCAIITGFGLLMFRLER